eukprot:gb/GECG01013201.1/.p1 GENE.gb/GECG01013201.1/~~gb/GECG01013201.1/.p1  ORF type:complete len:442 (+),score=59.80 gb/GECG01013201.1/:1-1326(+)
MSSSLSASAVDTSAPRCSSSGRNETETSRSASITVTIHGRRFPAELLEANKNSLYKLCRRFVWDEPSREEETFEPLNPAYKDLPKPAVSKNETEDEEVSVAQRPETRSTSKEKILGQNGYFSKELLLSSHLKYFKELRKWFQDASEIKMERYKDRLAKIDELRGKQSSSQNYRSHQASDGSKEKAENNGTQSTPPRSSSSEGGLEFLSAVAASPAGRTPDIHHKRLREGSGLRQNNFLNSFGFGVGESAESQSNQGVATLTDMVYSPNRTRPEGGAKRRKLSVFSPYSGQVASSASPSTAAFRVSASYASSGASPSATAVQTASKIIADSTEDTGIDANTAGQTDAATSEAASFLSPPPKLRDSEGDKRGSRTNSASHALAMLSRAGEGARDTDERGYKGSSYGSTFNTKRSLRAADYTEESEDPDHTHSLSIPQVHRRVV